MFTVATRQSTACQFYLLNTTALSMSFYSSIKKYCTPVIIASTFLASCATTIPAPVMPVGITSSENALKYQEHYDTIQSILFLEGKIQTGVVGSKSYSFTYDLQLANEDQAQINYSIPFSSQRIELIIPFNNKIITWRTYEGDKKPETKIFSDVDLFSQQYFGAKVPVKSLMDILLGKHLVPLYDEDGNVNNKLSINDEGLITAQVDEYNNLYNFEDYRLVQDKYKIPFKIAITTPNKTRILFKVDEYRVNVVPERYKLKQKKNTE